MRRRYWHLFLGRVVAAAAVAVGAGVPGRAAGQTPATIVGRVTDTAGTAVEGAEVLLQGADSSVIKTGKSNKRGAVTLRDLPAGGPYTILTRKIGYGAAQGTVQLHPGDTLYVDFELPPFAVTLAPIVVKARRSRYSAAGDDLKPKIYRDALTAVAWLRKDILGDPEWCSLPDSFGYQQRDRTRIKITDRIMLNSLGKDERQSDIRRRPWLDTIRFGGFDLPPLPYVRHVYINGVQADFPGDPFRSPAYVLRDTPTNRIVEMNYIDCWNTTLPAHMHYSIFIVLRPPTPQEQEEESRRRGARTPPPPSPEVLARRRQAWDSILRSAGWGDTTAKR